MTPTLTSDGAVRRGDRALFTGVFLVSAAVLLLQVALTRIFSFTIWYHFAYVTISVALLGYGASGTLLAVRPSLAGRLPHRRLSLFAALFSVAVLAALWGAARVPFHPFELTKAPRPQIGWMVLSYGLVTAPFFLAGCAVSLALKLRAERVSRLYFFDLCGAALGCLLVVPAIWRLSTPGAVVAAGVLAALAAAAFAFGDGGPGARAGLGGGLVLAALVATAGLVSVPRLGLMPSPEKFLHLVMRDPEHNFVVATRWTPIYRTDVYRFLDEEFTRQFSYAGWGISPHWKDQVPTRGLKVRGIAHDGDACAVIYGWGRDPAELEMFEHHIFATPYQVLHEPDVAIIGVGGGADILNAIAHGARHITGVELDPITVDVVRHDQADFAGHIYDRPDVTVVAGEGRSTLRRSQHRFDLIQLTGVDTMAALSTGAYVLSESYLYTTEAIGEFLDHLTPDGVLCFIQGDFDERHGFPRHSMRQVALFVNALEQRGIHDGEKRIAVLASTEGTPQVACLLANRPFTEAEVKRLWDYSMEQGFVVLALPGVVIDDRVHSRFLRQTEPERRQFLDEFPLVLRATTDDNPFFFSYYRWRNLGKSLGDVDVGHTLATGQIVLAAILAQSVVASAVLILLPLLFFRRRGLATAGSRGFVLYFAGIGLGFILVEISFVQKFVLFLGYPTYALTVVLFSLLLSSGIGSYLTGRMVSAPERRMGPLVGLLAAISLGYLAVLPRLFSALLGAPFAARVALCAALLLPLGLVMGMFFPTGILLARRAGDDFVPWAWGVNGVASVVGTILAVVLAMSFGFRVVTVVALCCYVVAALGLRVAASRNAAI